MDHSGFTSGFQDPTMVGTLFQIGDSSIKWPSAASRPELLVWDPSWPLQIPPAPMICPKKKIEKKKEWKIGKICDQCHRGLPGGLWIFYEPKMPTVDMDLPKHRRKILWFTCHPCCPDTRIHIVLYPVIHFLLKSFLSISCCICISICQPSWGLICGVYLMHAKSGAMMV